MTLTLPAVRPSSPPAPPAAIRPTRWRTTSRATLETPSGVAADHAADRALVRRLARGDGEAMSRLYDRHAASLFALLRRMLGEGGEAEEVLQEVFFQAWRQARRYRREGASPRGWLLMLARSRALDHLRASAARQRREETVVRERAEDTVSARGSRLIEQQERRRLVSHALGQLPAEQRRAVELAYFDGLTHREIAERTGAPLGTTKSRVLLGMKKLKQIFLAAGPSEPPGRPRRLHLVPSARPSG